MALDSRFLHRCWTERVARGSIWLRQGQRKVASYIRSSLMRGRSFSLGQITGPDRGDHRSGAYKSDRFLDVSTELIDAGHISQISAYIIMSTPTPFPVFCIGFVMAGFGSGLVLSLAAAFIMKLPERQNLKMCLFQAFYGVGALVAPLIATQFTSFPSKWRFHYLTSLGLATTSLILIALVFRGRPEHDLLPSGDSGEVTAVSNAESWKKMNQIMKVKAIHMLALWAFIYVGLEVTIGG